MKRTRRPKSQPEVNYRFNEPGPTCEALIEHRAWARASQADRDAIEALVSAEGHYAVGSQMFLGECQRRMIALLHDARNG